MVGLSGASPVGWIDFNLVPNCCRSSIQNHILILLFDLSHDLRKFCLTFLKPATGGNVFFDFLKLNRNTKKSFVFYCFFVLSLYFLKMKTFADFLNWTRSAEILYVAFQKLQKMLNHTTLLSHTVYVHTYLGTAPVKKILFLLGWTFFYQV